MPKAISIGRQAILDRIGEALDQVKQWQKLGNEGGVVRAAEYVHCAQALIELLEIADCRQVGGFGVHNGKVQSNMPKYRGSLMNRYRWLKSI
jgi:hypothetical protein